MTPDSSHAFLWHSSVGGAGNFMRNLVLLPISSDKWPGSSGVMVEHPRCLLSPWTSGPLFVSAWNKASYQPGCCSLEGSTLQILLWTKQVQLYISSFFFFKIDYSNYSLYYMKPKEKPKCTNSWPPASCSSVIRNYKLMLVVLYCSMGRFMSLCSQCWWNKLNWAWKRNKDLLSIWKPGFNAS